MTDFKTENSRLFSISITTSVDTYLIDLAELKQLYFIEDIYSFCMTGKLIFKDTHGIFEFGLMNGTEQIKVYYGEESDKVLDFYVYKINEISGSSSSNMFERNMIEVVFVDRYFHLLHSKHHSLSFKDEKYTDIVKQIMKEHCGVSTYDVVNDCKEKIPYYSTSYNTPATNIKWLMNRCSELKTKQPGYLLYNSTKDKSWNLTTLEKLLQQKTLTKPEGFKGIYTFTTENIYYINKILSYKINHLDHNSIKSLVSGNLLGFDPSRKKFLKREYTYKDGINRFTILGKQSLFPSDVEYIETKQQLTGEVDEKIMDNIYFSNWIKEYCMQQLVVMTVRGHEDRHAGGMIEVEWPSINADHKMNKNMIGKYLIKSVIHSFDNSGDFKYKQKLICIKNGYYESDDTRLVPAVNKNIGKQ
jgi:hypothetical protein